MYRQVRLEPCPSCKVKLPTRYSGWRFADPFCPSCMSRLPPFARSSKLVLAGTGAGLLLVAVLLVGLLGNPLIGNHPPPGGTSDTLKIVHIETLSNEKTTV